MATNFYFIWTHNVLNQLPVISIAQLVEHCTGIAEDKVSFPVQA